MNKINILLLSLLLSISAHAMPVLVMDSSGQVTGVTDLEFGGETFSGQFLTGSCIALFNNCDSNDDFNVGNATQSELLEVFFNEFLAPDSEGVFAFDDSPILTAGCSFSDDCFYVAPRAALIFGAIEVVSLSSIDNNAATGPFADEPDSFRLGNDSGGARRSDIVQGTGTFLVFEASPVPLPATAWLFGSALLGVLGLKRQWN